MTYELTDHAVKQARRHGISGDTIDLISVLADRRARVPGGAHALSISERARQRWIDGGLDPAAVDRAVGVVLIADLAERTIITVEHAYKRRHLHR